MTGYVPFNHPGLGGAGLTPQQIQYYQQLTNAQQANTQQGAQNGNWPANQALHSGAAAASGITGFQGAFLSGQIIPIGGSLGAIHSPASTLKSSGIRVGEIIGWRMFGLKGDYLTSYSAGEIYAPNEPMTAEADKMLKDPTNHTGIWSFKKERAAIKKMTEGSWGGGATVYGSIKMWGLVIEHELGYRAEFAKINSIDDICGIDNKVAKKNILAELREKYLKEA